MSSANLAEIRQIWLLEPYLPLRVEHENKDSWRAAVRRSQLQPALRLSQLLADADDRSGHYIVEATYLVPIDVVKASTRPCLCCGKPVRNSTTSVIGLTFHKKCLPGQLSPDRAEELTLFGEQLEQIKSWLDLVPL